MIGMLSSSVRPLIVALTVIAIGFAISASASTQVLAGDTARVSEDYVMRLALTEEQAAQFTPVIEAAAKARDEALARHGVDFEANKRPGLFKLLALKRDIDSINAQTENLLRQFLDRDQMAEYRRIAREREAAMRQRLMNMGS